MEKFPVWLTTNYACNLSCGWCYQREVANSTKMMDYQLAQALVDLCSGLPVKRMTLIGGEPTLYPHFLDITRYSKSKGFVTSVITNSIKFTDNGFVEEALAAGVNAVTTSVKGVSIQEYLQVTGRDAFDAVKKAILNLEASGVSHHVSMTISRSTITNWNQTIEFIRSCGAEKFYFSFEKPVILSDGITFDDEMLPQNIAGFVQDVIYPSLVNAGVIFKMELMLPHCVFREGFIERLEDECHAFGSCLLANCDGVIFSPDGSVIPCNHLIAYSLGRYGEDFRTPEEFLAWRQLRGASGFYKTAKLAPDERCAKCTKWTKCGAGCRLYWLYRGPNELLPISPMEKGDCL